MGKTTGVHKLRTQSRYERNHNQTRTQQPRPPLLHVQAIITEMINFSLSLSPLVMLGLLQPLYRRILLLPLRFCPCYIYNHINLGAIQKYSLNTRIRTYLQICSLLMRYLSDPIRLVLFPSGGTCFLTVGKNIVISTFDMVMHKEISHAQSEILKFMVMSNEYVLMKIQILKMKSRINLTIRKKVTVLPSKLLI